MGTTHDEHDEEIPSYPGLNEKQSLAVRFIVSGLSGAKTAELCGCAQSTLWYWRQKGAFKAAVHHELRENLREHDTEVLKHAKTAVQVLHDIMTNTGSKDRDRIRAAGLMLSRVDAVRGMGDPKWLAAALLLEEESDIDLTDPAQQDALIEELRYALPADVQKKLAKVLAV